MGNYPSSCPRTLESSGGSHNRRNHLLDVPRQTHGNDCGVFAVMYAIYKVQNLKFDFTVDDMPEIRIWIAGNILNEDDSMSNGSVNESYSEEEVMETHRTVQGEDLSQQEIIQMDINYIQKEKDGESVNNSKARPSKSDARKATEQVGRSRDEKVEGKGKKRVKKTAKRQRKMTEKEKRRKRFNEWMEEVTKKMDEEDAAKKPAETIESLLEKVKSMRPLLLEIAKTPRSKERPVERYQRHQAYLNIAMKNFRKYQMVEFGLKYFGVDYYCEFIKEVNQVLYWMFTERTPNKPGYLFLPPRQFINLPQDIDPSEMEGFYYIQNVLAEEAVTLVIMELEGCDYQMATGLAIGHPAPLNTLYHDYWEELLRLPKEKRPSELDGEARKAYDAKVVKFKNATPEIISFSDIPWPCADGLAEDMVAVMLSGTEKDELAKRKRLKELALFWHPDKFFTQYSGKFSTENRERIVVGVLDITKEISRCLDSAR
ncbi:hypothetical protein ACROYT_G021687 [Oculina patagonica]